MFVKTLLFLLPLSLFSQEIVWDSSSKSEISKEKYDKAMREYIEAAYPAEVSSYNAKLKEQSKYTVILNGLMWQDDKEVVTVAKNWQASKAYCADLDFAGFNDWRQPYLYELKDISDKSRESMIKVQFKNSLSNGYWSEKHSENKAWVFSFMTAKEYSFAKTMRYYTRCVRTR